MYKIEIFSRNAEETTRIGKIIAGHINDQMVIALIGPLAAGKTTLARSIFDDKGFGDKFSSPTYTIINEYNHDTKKAFHLDVYRISDMDELDYTGYEDCLSEGTFTVIEWADLIESRLPKDTFKITMDYGINDDERRITLYPLNEDLYIKLKEQTHAYSCN